MKSETIKRKNIGEKIRQARALSGITQEELGKALNVNGSAISKIESGVRSVNVLELEIIAQTTNQNLNFFYEEEKPEVKTNNNIIDVSGLSDKEIEIIVTVIDKIKELKTTADIADKRKEPAFGQEAKFNT
jgi:transcriptional regulator with XRE-family HTH domain